MDEKAPPYSPTGDEHAIQSTYIKPQARKLHDAEITFEEYNYYAQKTRAEEAGLPAPSTQWMSLIKRKKENDTAGDAVETHGEQINVNLSKKENRMSISDEEWVNASRAYRTASWGAAFYLV